MELQYIAGDSPLSLPLGDYIQTNNKELEIIARRHGFEPLYNQRRNSSDSLKWTNTNVFFSNKSIGSDSITDFHDNHHNTFCYLCSIDQHEHERTKPREEYKRRKLIPYKNPKARLSSSSLDRIAQDVSSDSIPYRFIIRTGTEKNSGTRAQVFLYMYGTEKNWTSIHLQGRLSSTSDDGFPSGSVRTFCLKGPNIGQLHHLNVNLVGSRSNKEWLLKEIEITNLNTSVTWLCEFNCWFPQTNEEEIEQVKPSIHHHTEFSLSIYILQIRTGEKSFAGTDANVQVTIRGSSNQTRRLALTSNRANLFEQNQFDTFAVVGKDLGDLLEITIESDRTQLATDWDIKEMIMWRILPSDNHKQSQIYFPFNTWLGKKVSTLKSKRETYPSTDHHLKGPICYHVSVKTGKVMNAGTDANVFLIIYGKSGRTIVHQLDNRLKNDFERNTTSEFTFMDIDVGEIDRIKIWHDNSGPGSAWFLDSVIIHKKYSTCYTISNIYIQRLEQISQALYRQIHEQLKKNSTVHSPVKNEDKHHRSASLRSLKSNMGSIDSLGNGRGILRSPVMNDKASLQKKVTWDEQSIGSQDDILSMESQRMKSMQINGEQKRKKEDSSHHISGHFDHQAYWISSHSYTDNKWHIKSIEEINSFDLDPTMRSLLLSDRLTINNKIKTTDDDIYECQSNRWLAKDKEDGKVEVYLTPKLIHKSTISSNANIDSKKKHSTSSYVQHKKYDDKDELNESKHSSPKDLGPIERTPRGLSQTDHKLSSLRLSNTPKTQLIDPSSHRNLPLKHQEKSSKINSSIDQSPLSSPLPPRSKSLRNIDDIPNSLDSEQELLARLTGQPPPHPRSSATFSSSPHQRLRALQNTNQRESLSESPREPPVHHPRSTPAATSSSSPHLKSPRNINDLTDPIHNERKSFTKNSDRLPSHSRSTPTLLSSIDQYSKSSRNRDDPMTSLPHTRDSLSRIPHEPSNERFKSSHNRDDPMTSLSRIPRESSDHFRSTGPSVSSSSHRLQSPRNPNELTNSITSEQELLERITGEPSHRTRSPGTPLTSLNQREKLPRNSNNLINSSMDERETSARTPREATTSLKSIRSSNEPNDSLSRPKPITRSHPNLPSQKSIHDQVYKSAYGTAPSDDF